MKLDNGVKTQASAANPLMTAAEAACTSTSPLPLLLLPGLILAMAEGVAEAATTVAMVISPQAGIRIGPMDRSESAWPAGPDAAPSLHCPPQSGSSLGRHPLESGHP